MKAENMEARILRHLSDVRESAMSKADRESECTLSSIALYVRCTPQYIGRLMSAKLIPAGLVMQRTTESGAEREGRRHMRKGTQVYLLTREGESKAGKLSLQKPRERVQWQKSNYGRRWSDYALNAAWLAEQRGLFDVSERTYKRSLSTCRGRGKRAWILMRLAAINYYRSDLREALHFLSQADTLLREDRSSVIATDCAMVRAVCYIRLFRTAEAARLLRLAARDYARHGEVLGEAMARHYLGNALAADRRMNEAFEAYRSGLAVFEKIKQKEWIALSCLTLANHLADTNNVKEATALAERALGLAAHVDNDLTKCLALCSMGGVLYAGGDLKSSEGYFRRSLSIALRLNDRRAIVDNMVWLTRTAAMSGDMQLAGKCLDRLAILAAAPDFKPTKRWLETGVGR